MSHIQVRREKLAAHNVALISRVELRVPPLTLRARCVRIAVLEAGGADKVDAGQSSGDYLGLQRFLQLVHAPKPTNSAV